MLSYYTLLFFLYYIVTTPKIGFDTKKTLHTNPQPPTHPPHKLSISNVSAVTHQILIKGRFLGEINSNNNIIINNNNNILSITNLILTKL